jgi:hypothetical protein
MDDGDLVVESAEVVPAESGRAGEILVGPPRPVVATGQGALRLLAYRAGAAIAPGHVLPSRPRKEA